VSVRMLESMLAAFGELRHEPIGKRVRALADGELIVDSVRAMLVYEPRRVVPSFAVPAADVRAELIPASRSNGQADGYEMGDAFGGHRVLDPSIPFDVHTAEGSPVTLGWPLGMREAAGFIPADPDLAGYVILDFDAFDVWLEEDERIYSHPRDPFHAMDILPSSRDVRIELDGVTLAQSSRAKLLFEGAVLPTRAYLPREDVLVPLVPTDLRTRCAYKGEASYFTVEIDGRTHENLAWTYEQPLRSAADVAGLVAFFNERVDVILDGEALPRALTPWSD
jgi:uncharacterized protein (DUF427 family)